MLEEHLRVQFRGVDRIDRIVARAKDPDSFMAKAARVKDGIPKYSEPLSQIQDQVGARIVVFYRDDVDRVSDIIKKYYRFIEAKTVVPDSEWEFGYFGKHMILALPADVVPEGINTDEVPRFFELQIKTLFQHAWSEANHDLGYKTPGELGKDHKRKLAFTAAQAWGADEIFHGLRLSVEREV